jgi:hypothetical protein
MKSNTLFIDQYSFKLLIEELQLNRAYNQNAMRSPEEVIISFNSLCEKLDVDQKTLRQWCNDGLINHSIIGRKKFFLLSDVLEMIRANKVE